MEVVCTDYEKRVSKIKADILIRVRIVFLGIALFGLWIAARIVTLQYVEGDKWIAKAEGSHVQERRIKAERGNVYDAEGRDLSVSIPTTAGSNPLPTG